MSKSSAPSALASLSADERESHVLSVIRQAASSMHLDIQDNTPLMEAENIKKAEMDFHLDFFLTDFMNVAIQDHVFSNVFYVSLDHFHPFSSFCCEMTLARLGLILCLQWSSVARSPVSSVQFDFPVR